MDILRYKDATTRRIYSYLTSKFVVAEQYVEAILWVIESQTLNAATLDRNKANTILNHIKDTIGYPTWFTASALFKAAFILAVFDYYSAFHYRFLVEMTANYPEFTMLALDEQQELLNYRNYLVVAIKLFDPNVRPAEMLLLIEKICGYTSGEQTTLVKRERRELVFFRVTGVLANFEAIKVPEKKKVGRPRYFDRKSNQRPLPPADETAIRKPSEVRMSFNTASVSNATSSAAVTASSIMAQSVLSKRPVETTSYAYYTKQQRTSATFDSQACFYPTGDKEARELDKAAEAAYLRLCQETMSGDDDEVQADDSSEGVPATFIRSEKEQSNTNRTVDAVHRELEQWKEKTNNTEEETNANQLMVSSKIAAEEAAKNARVKIFLRRLIVNTTDTSGTAATTSSSNESVISPRNVASDLATVSSDEAPGTAYPAQSLQDSMGSNTVRKISITEPSASTHLSSTSAASNSVHPRGEPLHMATNTPFCTIPVFPNGAYPYDGLPLRPPLAYSTLSFGLQSMHAVLNAHLGLPFPHSFAHQPRPPPSPAYDTNLPQLNVHSFGANQPFHQGYHANGYKQSHVKPFVPNDPGGTHFGVGQYASFHGSFAPSANPFAQHFHTSVGHSYDTHVTSAPVDVNTYPRQQQPEAVVMHALQPQQRLQETAGSTRLMPTVEGSNTASDSQYWTE
eukprot:gene7820-9328_t